jgi:hypothetical protein
MPATSQSRRGRLWIASSNLAKQTIEQRIRGFSTQTLAANQGVGSRDSTFDISLDPLLKSAVVFCALIHDADHTQVLPMHSWSKSSKISRYSVQIWCWDLLLQGSSPICFCASVRPKPKELSFVSWLSMRWLPQTSPPTIRITKWVESSVGLSLFQTWKATFEFNAHLNGH